MKQEEIKELAKDLMAMTVILCIALLALAFVNSPLFATKAGKKTKTEKK